MNSCSVLTTPIGQLTIVEEDGALVEVRFGSAPHPPFGHPLPASRGEGTVGQQLLEYFAGQRKTFDLPIKPKGTPFQLAVWQELLHIPYGETRTYGDIARAIGRAAAVRAVGAANGANPIPIVIPCHRVIGSNGSLTGFGGGIDMKRWLLDFEAGFLFTPPAPLR